MIVRMFTSLSSRSTAHLISLIVMLLEFKIRKPSKKILLRVGSRLILMRVLVHTRSCSLTNCSYVQGVPWAIGKKADGVSTPRVQQKSADFQSWRRLRYFETWKLKFFWKNFVVNFLWKELKSCRIQKDKQNCLFTLKVHFETT